MARPSLKSFVNFDQPYRKDEVWRFIGPLTGDYEVTITPRRLSASQRQRAYYFSCVVRLFSDFLSSQDYEDCDREHAHQLLKAKFLTVTVMHRQTGEVIGSRVRSITELDLPEMSKFIDDCRMWLLGYFRIRTHDPDPAWREQQQQKQRANNAQWQNN